jgi:tetratricopeptide (TPR) repeat protein
MKTDRCWVRAWLVMALALALASCADKDRNRAISAMNAGIAQYERGNYNGAVARFEEASRIDPDFGLPHYYAGMVRLRRFYSPDTAIPDLRRAADLMNDHAPTFYQLGSAYVEVGNRRDAESALRRAVEIEPEHARAWFRLGELRESNGQIMEAIDAYTRGIHADPWAPFGYKRLGGIYLTYEHSPEAVAVFRNGWENTRDPSLANDLATALLAANQPREAITAVQHALAADRSSVLFNYNLAAAYIQAYRTSQDPADRAQARAHLEVAARGCGELGSQARCNQIRMELRQLDSEGTSP